MVAATSADATARAQKDITALLRDRHHLAPAGDDDFSIRNLSEIAGAQQQGADTMTTLLASVAAVSLLVGGIGIMNIMLVSVTERTREIGIRMAVGAEPHHILTQFLVEALSLSLAGGLIGVGLGVGVAAWLAAHLHWPMLVQPGVITLSVGFSAIVGIVFGIYPARKASQLDSHRRAALRVTGRPTASAASEKRGHRAPTPNVRRSTHGLLHGLPSGQERSAHSLAACAHSARVAIDTGDHAIRSSPRPKRRQAREGAEAIRRAEGAEAARSRR